MGLVKYMRRAAPYIFAASILIPTSAKSDGPLEFKVGKTTTIEDRLGVDLADTFPLGELSDISKVMDSINSRYPNVIKRLTMAVDHSEYNFKSSSFSNATDSRFRGKVDLISIAQKDHIESQPYPDSLWTFKDTFAHEVGHLITTEYISLMHYYGIPEKKDSLFIYSIKNLSDDKIKESIQNMRASERLRESFAEINLRSLINYVGPIERIRMRLEIIKEALSKHSQIPNTKTSEEEKRPIGFVSTLASFANGPFNWDESFHRLWFQMSELHKNKDLSKFLSNDGDLEEDIAETFAYMVNNHHYADNDSLVQEKIKAIDDFMKTVYGGK